MPRCYVPNRSKLTKIVATVSGSSCTEELLRELFLRGMDVVRMNSAHMTLEEMENLIAMVRRVSPHLAVMLDTKGPNIRTCSLPESGLPFKKGDRVRFSGLPGRDDRIQVNYEPFADEVPTGSRIVCDDGAASFLVTGKSGDYLEAEVNFDCTVMNRKSVNVPNVSLNAPALSGKDREFLAAAVRLHCDLVAHSFVRSAADIEEVRAALGPEGKDIGIIAKIENREGVRNIGGILTASDGIMVARGDLGIEIPLEEVPGIQKNLIHEARKFAKPVITATQMLQSMEHSPAPTRAEVSDVANAVYDGTDAVMLSGETAHGDFPREAVSMMAKIVTEAERAPRQFFPVLQETPENRKDSAYILSAAVRAADSLSVKAIACCTINGQSAQVCSAMRPQIPVYALTPVEVVMRKLNLCFGVFASLAEYDAEPVHQAYQIISRLSRQDAGLCGSDLVMVLGKNSPKVSRNNMLCLATLDELKK